MAAGMLTVVSEDGIRLVLEGNGRIRRMSSMLYKVLSPNRKTVILGETGDTMDTMTRRDDIGTYRREMEGGFSTHDKTSIKQPLELTVPWYRYRIQDDDISDNSTERSSRRLLTCDEPARIPSHSRDPSWHTYISQRVRQSA
jgi:hypothetical protein